MPIDNYLLTEAKFILHLLVQNVGHKMRYNSVIFYAYFYSIYFIRKQINMKQYVLVASATYFNGMSNERAVLNTLTFQDLAKCFHSSSQH